MYALNMIVHFRSVYQSAQMIGAQVKVDFRSMRLELSRDGAYHELVPSFASSRSDEAWLELRAEMDAGVSEFAGWSFGETYDFPIRDDRLAFKTFCETNGLSTPALLSKSAKSTATVVAKEVSPSTTRRGVVKGPMPLSAAFGAGAESLKGFYVEEYVDGDPFQSWYFGGKLACVEKRKKPSIVGNGQSSVRDLVARIAFPTVAHDQKAVDSFLSLQGFNMDSILPVGQPLFVGLDFHSLLQKYTVVNENILQELSGSAVLDQLKQAGALVSETLPESQRKRALFSLIGVVDANGKVWLTSVTTHRYVHPDVYLKMVPAIFEVSVADEVVAKTPAVIAAPH